MEIGGYSTHHRPPPFARGLPSFEEIDADTSGGISLQEYQDAAKTRRGHGRGPDPAKRFARIDGDADGSITNGELSAFRARFQPATAGALIGAQETRPEAKPETGPPSLEDRLAELFAKLDGDGDGAISLSELLAAVRNLPTGNNDPDEGDGPDAAEAASGGSGTGVTDAVENGVTAAVEESATAIPAGDEPAATSVDATASAETGTTAATGASAAPAALGDAAIDRLAALLATRIQAYLKAGTQNAAAETTLSATA